jgi:hypothetical protein
MQTQTKLHHAHAQQQDTLSPPQEAIIHEALGILASRLK